MPGDMLRAGGACGALLEALLPDLELFGQPSAGTEGNGTLVDTVTKGIQLYEVLY